MRLVRHIKFERKKKRKKVCIKCRNEIEMIVKYVFMVGRSVYSNWKVTSLLSFPEWNETGHVSETWVKYGKSFLPKHNSDVQRSVERWHISLQSISVGMLRYQVWYFSFVHTDGFLQRRNKNDTKTEPTALKYERHSIIIINKKNKQKATKRRIRPQRKRQKYD